MNINNPQSDNLEKVITNAGKIALKFGGNQVGTEHILYGLTSVKECMASKILSEFGVTEKSLLDVFEESADTQSIFGIDVELTPRSKEIIAMAKQVAIELGHSFVGTEHLLFALLSSTGSFAVRLLQSYYRVNITEIKTKVLNVLQSANTQNDSSQDGSGEKSELPENVRSSIWLWISNCLYDKKERMRAQKLQE